MADNDPESLAKLEQLKRAYALEYEMVRATATFEHALLRPLFILNGGALVAYLALFGALNRSTDTLASLDFSWGQFAVYLWLAGLLVATLAAYLGAQSQFEFRKQRGREADHAEIERGIRSGSALDMATEGAKRGAQAVCARRAAIAAGLLSILLFMAGFWPAFQSINSR